MLSDRGGRPHGGACQRMGFPRVQPALDWRQVSLQDRVNKLLLSTYSGPGALVTSEGPRLQGSKPKLGGVKCFAPDHRASRWQGGSELESVLTLRTEGGGPGLPQSPECEQGGEGHQGTGGGWGGGSLAAGLTRVPSSAGEGAALGSPRSNEENPPTCFGDLGWGSRGCDS